MGFLHNIQQVAKEVLADVPQTLDLSIESYVQMLEIAEHMEVIEQVRKIDAWCDAHKDGDEGQARAAFMVLCAEREKNLAGSCLSYSAMPESICNRLYWEIAKELFHPANFGEMLAILMPNVRYAVELDYHRPISSRKVTDTEVALARQPLTILKQPVETPAIFKRFMIISTGIFNIEQLANLPFWLHHKLYLLSQRLNYSWVYGWNDDLKTLQQKIDMVEKNGITPREKIIRLIKEFYRAGEHITGDEEAAISGKKAYEEFKEYLEKLPKDLHDKLLVLRDKDGRSFVDVMEHLRRGNCIEEAAGRFKEILANPANKATLDFRPALTDAELTEINQFYRVNSIEVEGRDETTVIPANLRKSILEKTSFEGEEDLIMLLSSLPITEYYNFLEHLPFDSDMYFSLAEVFSTGMFSEDQKQTFYQAILELKEKFPDPFFLLEFALRCDQFPLQMLMDLFSEDEKFLLETGKNTQYFSALALAALWGTPENWQVVVMTLYSEKMIIEETRRAGFVVSTMTPCSAEEYVLHTLENDELDLLEFAIIGSNFAMIKKLLSYYPSDEARLARLKRKDAKGRSALHKAAKSENPEVFRTVLSFYPPEERLLAIQEKNAKGRIVLQYASSPETLDAILTIYPDEDAQLAAIKSEDNQSANLLLLALKKSNIEVFEKVILLYPATERLEALRKNNWLLAINVANKCYPDYQEAILNSLNDNEKKILISAIGLNNLVGNYLGLVKEILSCYTSNGRLVIFQKNILAYQPPRSLFETIPDRRCFLLFSSVFDTSDLIYCGLRFSNAAFRQRVLNDENVKTHCASKNIDLVRIGMLVDYIVYHIATCQTPTQAFQALKALDPITRRVMLDDQEFKTHCQSKNIDLNYIATLIDQMSKQGEQRRRRKKWIIIAAIFLTPLSLLVTLPLWYLAKSRDLLQGLTTTVMEYKAVKEKRKALKTGSTPVVNPEKPRKILLSEEDGKVTYLVDREQLKRFSMFTNPRKSKTCTLEMLNESKAKSSAWRRGFGSSAA